MGTITYLRDRLTNLVANLGTKRDKAASSYYATPILTDQQLIAMYRTSWMAKKIVNIPAADSIRRWREWQADNTQIEAIEAEEKRLGLQGKLYNALAKARLYGGAAILIGDGSAPEDPLDPSRIAKQGIRYLAVLSRRELSTGEIEDDPESPYFNTPREYELSGTRSHLKIHPSRMVLVQGGNRMDDELVPGASQGWGDSVLLPVLDAVKNSDATIANIASLVFEAKVDVVRIPDLMQNMATPEYEEKLLSRLRLAATGKGINGTLILDSEEDYSQKTASFQTLPDLIAAFLQIVSGAADIPATRFLGQSPAGMNATGESDVRNYYDRISAEQEITLSPAMATLDECLIRSALGSRPEDVHYIWRPLWQISDKERAEIGEKNANTAQKLSDTGLIPQEVLSKVVVNQAVQNSFYPGLEDAMNEFEAANPDYFDDPDPDHEEAKSDDPLQAGGAGSEERA